MILLPGVGNFSAACGNLESLKEAILGRVNSGTPVLGICLGMQLLFDCSDEGEGKGLSLFMGKNIRLPGSVKTPHMGWNTLDIVRQNELLRDISSGSYAYFVHSYYPLPADKDVTTAETTYGLTFSSAIERQNVFATQFHPEKSGQSGAMLLKNLLKITRR